MIHKRNYAGVNESQSFEPLPDGNYNVQIERTEESKTKLGLPMIKIRYSVMSGEHKGRKLFDQVTLFNPGEKGAGITKHFLHVIGEPYEGEFDINPDNWVSKELSVKVVYNPKFESNNIEAREFIEEIPF